MQVKVHFDNFAAKWDELFTMEDFQAKKIQPLYSHAPPKTKPTEFMVHHRYTDRHSRMSNLFGHIKNLLFHVFTKT